MGASKPVIGAQAGGIPGVIDDGVNGYLVPFGDVRAIVERLQRLLETPAKAREMGRLGYEQVTTHYSWSAVLQRTLAGYEQARQRFTHRAGADVTS